MGVGTRSKAWRFTDINKDYAVRSQPPMRQVTFICNASAIFPLVLFDLPFASRRADENQRLDVAIRGQIPQ